MARILRVPVTDKDDLPFVVSVAAYGLNTVISGLLKASYATGGSVTMRGLHLVDSDKVSAKFDLHLYNAPPSVHGNGDTFAPTIADAQNELGIVTINASHYNSFAAYDIAHVAIPSFIDVPENSDGMVYGYMVATSNSTQFTHADALSLYLDFWTA